MKIFCIGHAVYDITLPVDKFPKENTKKRVTDRMECAGGSSSNAAVLLARWGEKTYFLGTVGDDLYGKRLRKDFTNNNVDTRYLMVTKGINTSISHIITALDKGTRTIITYVDQELKSSLKSVRTKPDVIFLDGNEYDLSVNVINKNKKAIKVIDAGKYTEDMVKLAHKADYVVCSKNFAEDYAKIIIDYKDLNTVKKAYKKLEADFKGTVVITLEALGSFAKIDDKYELVPSIKVPVVDSTGAGDIYHGAFTYFIAHGYSLKETMRLSNITGGLSVTKLGSRNSIPTLEEVLNYDK